MVIALTHIALHVADVDACVAFYQNYAGLQIVRERGTAEKPIYWLAELGKEQDFIMVILPGGPEKHQAEHDFSHLGFALQSKQAVDDIAEKARLEGILAWPCKQEPYPVGYYCGIKDPNGSFVEFSYGQPLGPGAKDFNER